MKYLIFAIVMVLPGALFAQDCSKTEPTCDAKSQAAIEYMTQRFGDIDNAVEVWYDNGYSPEYRASLLTRKKRMQKIEAWARTLKNPRDRQAYMGVLEAYYDGIDEALAENSTHAQQKELAAYERHQQQCDEKTRRMQADKKTALPEPPE